MEKKLIFAIVCLLLGAVGLFLTVVFFLASRAFDAANEKESKWVGRAPASLKATKHKKDVTIYGRVPGEGRKRLFFKDMTTGTYAYTVNGKTYKRRVTNVLTTPRQMPYLTSAFYIKIFPRISYLKEDLGQPYLFQSLILLLPSVMLFWAGVKGISTWLAL
jgi:hypothetical protein